MKIQLLKRTVKLRIDRHIIVIPREKDNMHNYPHGSRGGGHIALAMGFCEFQAVKFSQSREVHRCTRKREECTRNRHTSGRGSPPDRSIRLCACGTLRTADWYNERLNVCGGERFRDALLFLPGYFASLTRRGFLFLFFPWFQEHSWLVQGCVSYGPCFWT